MIRAAASTQPFGGLLISMKTLAIVLISGVVVFGQSKPRQPTRHARVPAIVGVTYIRARKMLLAAGWHPLRTNSSATDEGVSSWNGPLFWRRGYIELENCSGTRLAACAFLFKDRFGNQLRVITEGEELPKDNAHAQVISTRFVWD
ncbi:MAG: hypothetical protein QOG23_4454 [Blastocatellia bacterium]|nr:hypothetical protein [Blastocatellia bacterium]